MKRQDWSGYVEAAIIPFTENNIDFYVGWDGYKYATVFTDEFEATWHLLYPGRRVAMDIWAFGDTPLEAVEELVRLSEEAHPWRRTDRAFFMYVGSGDLGMRG